MSGALPSIPPQPGHVAALFVERDGVYSGLDDVEVWDEERDARLYAGPYPVVAHPPCARWSRLAGFTEARWGYKRGDDGGCFEAALRSVRTFGGVLEHPAYSKAWDRFGLPKPTVRHGWTRSLLDGGASCYVEQARYGLPVKKATWLYAFGVDLAELRWGYTPDGDGESPRGPWGGIDGWRDSWTSKGSGATSRTPIEFRDALLAMARTAALPSIPPQPGRPPIRIPPNRPYPRPPKRPPRTVAVVVPYRETAHDADYFVVDTPAVPVAAMGHASALPMSPKDKAARRRRRNPVGFYTPSTKETDE